MKKKTALFLVLLVVALMLSGCGDKRGYIGKMVNSQMGYYSVYYTRFTGEDLSEIYLEETKTVTISVVTHKGLLDMEILSTDERGVEASIYSGKELETGVSKITLDEGIYRIKSYGIKHSGGYSISY